MTGAPSTRRHGSLVHKGGLMDGGHCEEGKGQDELDFRQIGAHISRQRRK